MSHMRSMVLLFLACLSLGSGTALAQLSGENIGGDFGMKSGSQPPPGAYLTDFIYTYDASKIVGGQGQEINLQSPLRIWANIPLLWVVTDKKLFGANYSYMVGFPIPNLAIEAPRVDLKKSAFGFGDLYVQPINLGWHKKRADIMAWYGFYAPTGGYSPSGGGGVGLGMWSHEVAVGSTFYLNEKKTLHASVLPQLEFHSKKKGSDVKVGDILTIEGGVGKTSKQILDVGMAYYAQWKLTDDSGLALPALVQNRLGKNRNYGLGPEVSLLLPLTKDFSKLLIFDIKYLFETGTKLDTKGQALVVSFTFKLL